MDKLDVTEIAVKLGWGVRDLNDNDRGRVIKGNRFQVYNPYMPDTGPTFWTEEEGWNFIVGRIQGGVMPTANGKDADVNVTGSRGTMLRELMSYRHPSLENVPRNNIRGNVYALTQRKQGNAASFYTMSVGIEVGVKIPMNGFWTTEFKTFHAPCEGFDPVAQEQAMLTIYQQFKGWLVASVDTV